MKLLYIFDLDGTLALCAHRLHHITGEKKDWPAFFEACADDQPCHALISVARGLRDGGAEIWVWTGRSDAVTTKTYSWLAQHDVPCHQLQMRRDGDHQPDDHLKNEWLDSMRESNRSRLVGVFEDRSRVVEMWRTNNVPCFQVADGDF